MKLQVGKAVPQLRKLALGFLHAVFTENTLTGAQRRLDRLDRMRFADRYQRDVRAVGSRCLDGCTDRRETGSDGTV